MKLTHDHRKHKSKFLSPISKFVVFAVRTINTYNQPQYCSQSIQLDQ